MRWAFGLASRFLPDHRCKFNRKDFTLPQLFACLVLREHQKKSYRGVEALLADCQDWRRDIGLTRTPDHNTLCRAFGYLVKPGLINRMLDQVALWARERKMLKGRVKPLAIDSSMFESHHVSRHFEKRCQQTARKSRRKSPQIEANRRRRQIVKALPKLSLAVASACHLILAARATTGCGADHPHFAPLLRQARRRAKINCAVADSGYDSEANHLLARHDIGVRSIIPAQHGRPDKQGRPPRGRWRRRMKTMLATKRGRRRCGYTQRWQVETVNSMIKRNLGSALRARTSRRRSNELLLRALTHNIMIVRHC
jgi:hypothetical protein